MFSYRTLTAAAVLSAVMSWGGPVEAAGEQKLGYVDLQKIVFESKIGKAGIAELKTFQEARQKEISTKEGELVKLKKDFETQQSALSDAAKKVQADKMAAAEIALKRLLEDSDRELRDRRNQLLERITKEVGAVIVKVGAEKGYGMILERDVSILYADPAFDVTDLVIERYNQTAKP